MIPPSAAPEGLTARRSRVEVAAAIVNALAAGPLPRTRAMARANLTWAKFVEVEPQLRAAGFVRPAALEGGGVGVAATPEGLAWAGELARLVSMLAPEGAP